MSKKFIKKKYSKKFYIDPLNINPKNTKSNLNDNPTEFCDFSLNDCQQVSEKKNTEDNYLPINMPTTPPFLPSISHYPSIIDLLNSNTYDPPPELFNSDPYPPPQTSYEEISYNIPPPQLNNSLPNLDSSTKVNLRANVV